MDGRTDDAFEAGEVFFRRDGGNVPVVYVSVTYFYLNARLETN